MVLLPGVFAADQNLKIGDKVPDFVLEGADGQQYRLDKMGGKTVILVLSPRKVGDDGDRLVNMLMKSFPKNEGLEIFTVFDMLGIPFFITDDFVRGKVREKQENHPVTILMDWKQKVNNLLGANEDEIDVFIIDPSGFLVSHQVGTYSEHKLNLLIKEIKKTSKSSN